MRIVMSFVIGLTAAACRSDGGVEAVPPSATYVGEETCATCHAEEAAAWRGSHHDLAMQPATDETVLGDFDDVEFVIAGVSSQFFRRGDAYVVRTEGVGGALADFEVEYVFGVEPLQQYLVAFPGGRYQTLPLCWDSRTESEGGARWFHVYPDEPIPADNHCKPSIIG